MDCYCSDMNRRTITGTVAQNVVSAAAAHGVASAAIAEATDMNLSDLESRLSAETPFTISELVRVGGFLCVPADLLMEGAA